MGYRGLPRGSGCLYEDFAFLLKQNSFNRIQYHPPQYNTLQYNTIEYSTIQYNTTQCNALQYNKRHHDTIMLQINAMEYYARPVPQIVCETLEIRLRIKGFY